MLDMLRNGDIHPLFFLAVMQTIIFVPLCMVMAKYRNQNLLKAFLIGFIPSVNFFYVLFLLFIPKKMLNPK